MNLPEKANLEKIYGENSACAARFQNLADNFARIYKHDHADFFTSPGRTEIIGNHVDHNGGKVIAGSINLDTIVAAAPSQLSERNLCPGCRYDGRCEEEWLSDSWF